MTGPYVSSSLLLQRLRTENRLLRQRIDNLEKVRTLMSCTWYFPVKSHGHNRVAGVRMSWDLPFTSSEFKDFN